MPRRHPLLRLLALPMVLTFLVNDALSAPPPSDLHAPDQWEHHPDIRIEVYAIEPQVVDPVALTFAANGDCYVVEMRDYPRGLPDQPNGAGTVRRLRDRDHDGRIDESTVFADHLQFPTSIACWRDGFLVLAPPHLIFLRDTNDDGVADERHIVIDGFQVGVTDSNANSLRWGLDQRLHGANGGNGGNLVFADRSDKPVSLGMRDFTIDMTTRQIEPSLATGGGFGLVWDDFGHSFTTYNINYLQQRVISPQHFDHSPEVEPFPGTVNISDHGEAARIYPVVTAVTRVNHPEQAGHFSSAGGMGILPGPPFSPRLARSLFVCDVVCNLVHRDQWRENGPVFAAGRTAEEQTTEFLASHDPACRPVGLESGPDGALYLLDMQRDVIEHPDYIPASVLAEVDLRAGSDRGRIFRITPREGLAPGFPDLEHASHQALIAALANDARWSQETAQRLLVERHAIDVVDDIRAVAQHDGRPSVRARAWFVLHTLRQLSNADLEMALHDAEPGVREVGIQLALLRPDARVIEVDEFVRLLDDPHPRVRFQAALALDGRTHRDKAMGLKHLLRRDGDSTWTRRAILLAADDTIIELLAFLGTSQHDQASSAALRLPEVWYDVVQTAAARAASTTDQQALVDWLTNVELAAITTEQRAALLRGLLTAWRRRPASQPAGDHIAQLVAQWAALRLPDCEHPLLELAQQLSVSLPSELQHALDEAFVRFETLPDRDESARLRDLAIIARGASDRALPLLYRALRPAETTNIQRAALQALQQFHPAGLQSEVVARWATFPPALRPDVISFLLSAPAGHDALLGALERHELRVGELNLDLEQRRQLLREATPAIRERAAQFFRDEEYAHRKTIVADWLAKLPATGDPVAGKTFFQSKCATCHQVGGIGHRVGPDLQALSHRSVEDLVSHILDPNMSINPNYVACVVETRDGRVLNGLLAGETSTEIILLQPEAQRVTIARDAIEDLRTRETSLMPEGLEQDLTPAQLRDLVSFLQAARP